MSAFRNTGQCKDLNLVQDWLVRFPKYGPLSLEDQADADTVSLVVNWCINHLYMETSTGKNASKIMAFER